VASVLVHIDLDGERPNASSMAALAAGRHVATSWGATLYATVFVHDPAHVNPTRAIESPMPKSVALGPLETALSRGGADKIIVALTRDPVAPLWATVGHAWQGVVDRVRPRLVLFGADAPSATELGPRTAARTGARLLLRASATGSDEVQLRDRDGGYVRSSETGAAVVLIGRAARLEAAAEPSQVDVVVLAMPGARDTRIELLSSAPAEPAELMQATGTLIALGDDVADDPDVAASARRLAELMNGQVVGGAAVAKAGVVSLGAVIDRTIGLAPELCIIVGAVQIDVAGATRVVKIGATGPCRITTVDGALTGAASVGLADLVSKLETA
jgi:hypothetical protein